MKAESLARQIALAGFALVLACGCATQDRSVIDPKISKRRTAHELRVMTFNLRVRTILDGHNIWDKRRDLVVERVRAFDADLLGTQEGLDSMETYLRQQLGDYTFRGVGRDDGKQRGEMCGVFFKTARFELLEGGYFWLSKTPEKPGSRGWAAASVWACGHRGGGESRILRGRGQLQHALPQFPHLPIWSGYELHRGHSSFDR